MNNKDDERLRKTTIAFLKDFAKQGYENAVECIDWLEKQSEKPQGKSALEAAKEEKVDNQNCVKPTDKVEPKFREGDWVVQGYNILKIKCVGDTHYCFETVGGYTDDILISEVDSQYHLWTIQDAKDGDVLFQDLMDGMTFIYNGINPDMAILYSFIINNDGKDVLPYHIGKPNTGIGDIEENKNIIHPATKKQRELLFQKMKEAGYEWDAEKKELKKIEQKPNNHVQWSDEEELHIKELESLVKKVWAIAERENDKDTIREMSDLSFFLKTLNLEKKGEQRPNPYSGTSFGYNGHTWGMCARDGGVEILVDGHVKSRVFANDGNAKEMFIKALERVEEENSKGYKLTDCDKNSWWEDFKAYTSCTIEQKLADKVEPKFKQGEWIIFNGLILYVDEVVQGYYRTISIDGIPNSYDWDIDNAARLWTIQDAKDGDVLSYRDGQWIYLYKEKIDDSSFDYHILYSTIHQDLTINDSGFTLLSDAIIPATKEQRDLLFTKMHEAGYEWDAEKKELKEIEKKPVWSEDDEKMLNSIIEDFGDGKTSNMLQEYFLKSLKSRVQPQPKQEWSEEDERSIRDSIFYLKSAKKYFEKDDDILWDEKWFNLCIEWLESLYKKLRLQSQWKPSEEQMNALDSTLQYSQVSHNSFEYLNSLFNDLKKLREE